MNGKFSLHSTRRRSSSGRSGLIIWETTDYQRGKVTEAFRDYFDKEYDWSEHHRGIERVRPVDPLSKVGQDYIWRRYQESLQSAHCSTQNAKRLLKLLIVKPRRGK